MDFLNFEKNTNAGYYLAPRVKLGLIGLLGQQDGVRATLLTGLPGVGKTSLPRQLAAAKGIPAANVIEYLFHDWSNSDELFSGINVKEVVRGNPDGVHLDGALAVAARRSHEGETILILDELDKARDFVENILLQFLQDGIVQGATTNDGKPLIANLAHLLVFITSNGTRAHGDALLRRVLRLDVPALPDDVVRNLVIDWTNAPKGVVSTAINESKKVAEAEETYVSPQEIRRLVNHLREIKAAKLLDSVDVVREVLAMWASKSTEPGASTNVVRQAGSSLFGELNKSEIWESPNETY